MLNYIITNNTITVLIDGIPMVIDNTHRNYESIEKAIMDKKSIDDIKSLIDISSEIKKVYNELEIIDGEIYYNGNVVHSALSKRILSMKDKGFDITPFTNFMKNLYKNPSNRSVNELYTFLEKCNLPITEDGHFLAYKKVAENYTDCYSGTFDNSIGSIVEMPRNEVDEDSSITCSNGLHVASYSYMKSYYGHHIVVCKVNPEDVVSIPIDYNNAKMRVCKYEVINEVALENEELEEDVINDDNAYNDCSNKTPKKFSKELYKLLSSYNQTDWIKIDNFLLDRNVYLTPIISTCLYNKDANKLIKELKNFKKKNIFSKEELFAYLDI